MRLLFLASAVGPLGAPETGGVTRYLRNSAKALSAAGHAVEVLAPGGGETAGLAVETVAGRFQPSAAAPEPAPSFALPPESLLAALLKRAWRRQGEVDLVVNLNHDWLPYYLTPFFRTPLGHIANLAAGDRASDAEIRATARAMPGRVAALGPTQARLLGLDDPPLVPFCLDFDDYALGAGTGGYLAWAGRIAPEKGLINAARAAAAAGLPLKVAGGIEDERYWHDVLATCPDTVEHVGFLATGPLQALIGDARALLQMQEWEEAFGGITLEALACGTPVVAYRRGANVELVRDGVNGLLVAPGDLDGAVPAIGRAGTLDRAAIRAAAAADFGLVRMAEAYADWFRRLGLS